ncbi:hypothetical protein J6590_103543 [Homalodisca vitripennis]|nr:hypothetical protein J6590_103543 [Homalodisca vitripennis]
MNCLNVALAFIAATNMRELKKYRSIFGLRPQIYLFESNPRQNVVSDSAIFAVCQGSRALLDLKRWRKGRHIPEGSRTISPRHLVTPSEARAICAGGVDSLMVTNRLWNRRLQPVPARARHSPGFSRSLDFITHSAGRLGPKVTSESGSLDKLSVVLPRQQSHGPDSGTMSTDHLACGDFPHFWRFGSVGLTVQQFWTDVEAQNDSGTDVISIWRLVDCYVSF